MFIFGLVKANSTFQFVLEIQSGLPAALLYLQLILFSCCLQTVLIETRPTFATGRCFRGTIYTH